MILVIDNYDSFTYNLVQYLGQMSPVTVRRNDAVSVEQVGALNPDGIVISPGPGRAEDAGISVDLIRQLGAQIPILGVCLGHQAIAVAYGGRVVPASRLMHGKADWVRHQGRGLLKNLPQPFLAGRYHSLMVDVAGVPDLVVDADSEDGTVMAISHRDYPVYGIQFHPESVLTAEGMTILAHFVDCTAKIEGVHA
ncbi:anthranilate synthase component II [Sulfobacillus harzensis]|uniref:Aminodeoxychorismate/anthranilate synthase component II n=1 Tax=Sulfobacillus harzensis TaxID=2729629 RepID=A0A7Y0L3T9_9FIRM|nr:aminodeoxychorismate/anthranilate synthase component II [Sulfobacillus harzensis]NMP22417.1 aminodeoxychorismate/anthranilate synthase component II [Sulfobacillus harzensis]